MSLPNITSVKNEETKTHRDYIDLPKTHSHPVKELEPESRSLGSFPPHHSVLLICTANKEKHKILKAARKTQLQAYQGHSSIALKPG